MAKTKSKDIIGAAKIKAKMSSANDKLKNHKKQNGGTDNVLVISTIDDLARIDNTCKHIKIHFGNIVESIEAIVEALKKTKKLVTLDLSKNNISAKDAIALASILKNMTTMKTLDIGHNNLGDKGAANIAGALQYMRSLSTLNIAFNNIGSSGITAISEAIELLPVVAVTNRDDFNDIMIGKLDGFYNNKNIRASIYNTMGNVSKSILGKNLAVLNLSGNNIRDVGAAALAEALPSMTNLTTLDLGYNHIGAAGMAALTQALPSMTSLNLGGNT